MKTIIPDYYTSFHCIAGACRHSCCLDWEVEIDEETFDEYCLMDGRLGDKMKEYLVADEEGGHFRMTEDGRCPFLNEENLCELILEHGEGCLSQICTDHPRFRNFWSDRVEMGLGIVCEEAARLILSKEDKVKLVILEDDGREEDMDGEGELLVFRDALMDVLQDREIPTDERIRDMLFVSGIEDDFLSFEEGPLNETACEQLAVYLLYRTLPDCLYDDRLEDRIRFVAESYMRVRNEWAIGGKTDIASLIEPARRFSEEVEYDTDTWGME